MDYHPYGPLGHISPLLAGGVIPQDPQQVPTSLGGTSAMPGGPSMPPLAPSMTPSLAGGGPISPAGALPPSLAGGALGSGAPLMPPHPSLLFHYGESSGK